MCSNNNSIHSQQQLLNWLIVLAVFMQQVHSTPMAKMVVSNNKDKGNTVTDMKTSAMPTMPSTTTVAAAATETKTATGTASASTRVRALKMLGPNPLAPGQKGTVKTAYFDPKVRANSLPVGEFQISIQLLSDIQHKGFARFPPVDAGLECGHSAHG